MMFELEYDLLHLTTADDHSCSNYKYGNFFLFWTEKLLMRIRIYDVNFIMDTHRSFSLKLMAPSSVFGHNSFIYLLFNYMNMSNFALILLFCSAIERERVLFLLVILNINRSVRSNITKRFLTCAHNSLVYDSFFPFLLSLSISYRKFSSMMKL